MPDATPPSPARSLLRRVLIGLVLAVGLATAVLAIGAGLLYRAATAAVPKYEALLRDLDEREAAGELDRQRQELESRVAAFYSEAQSEPRWRAVVTADQLNGWLAVQLPIELPDLEESGVRDPRLLLGEGDATLACRARVRGVDVVVSATLAPLVAEDGWVGFQIESVRVGRLAMPVATLVNLVDRAARELGAGPEELRYRWAEAEGAPVLLFDVEHLASTAEQVRRVDAIEVRPGELLVSGVTEPLGPAAAGASAGAASLPMPTE